MRKFILITAFFIFLPVTMGSAIEYVNHGQKLYYLLRSNGRNRGRKIKEEMYQRAERAFRRHTKAFKIDQRIAYNLLRRESVNGNLYAYNGDYKARGLGQHTPIAIREYAQKTGTRGLFLKDGRVNKYRVYDPDLNIKMTCWHLRRYLNRHGEDYQKAIEDYNAGPRTMKQARFARSWAQRIINE